ncbi:hypothetical protein SAMN02745146_0070 [Hymenobacter daecheongensis DSM 21074]|uniref:AAA+ ATPase domain-containing protein n=1 Tax=Hymenobacter daecheongensis DSM 21074 TaxID=1121955 RepID=A0A1M6LVE3_9BACT|nr:hypothetical protein [Hymenobacter daecheongensis]SHJ75197.1 hypothetical protein SAMN02745146_0070 [Hymenobacter daecheongensis DSM 21074]
MGKSISIHELDKKHYPLMPLSEEWQQYIGHPEIGFRMLVWGESGHGKTTFVVKLCKELAQHGKVYYNSIEQGEGASIQKVMRLCNVTADCKPGSFMLGDRDSYQEMWDKLAKPRQRVRFVVIDSLQYISLTKDQYKQLTETFPRIALIIISWSEGSGQPKGDTAKSIRYMVDIKTQVKKGVARSDSRFGATVPYQVIPWEEKERAPAARGQKLLDVGQQQLALVENG